tara:strand:+ start:88 stop:279 length:192 start_codon:yes stop_codon:yes gene_type:complete
MIPIGVQLIDDHLLYKIGVHNKAFIWLNNRWQLSTKSPEWIKKHKHFGLTTEQVKGLEKNGKK